MNPCCLFSGSPLDEGQVVASAQLVEVAVFSGHVPLSHLHGGAESTEAFEAQVLVLQLSWAETTHPSGQRGRAAISPALAQS